MPDSPQRIRGFLVLVGWSAALPLGLIGACGGKAAETAGDGDGDSSGDGDVGASPGDGDKVISGDGDGSSPGDAFDRSCGTSIECVLVGSSCCGGCGVQAVADFTALRAGQNPEYYDSICRGVGGCPDCVSIGNPNIYATCSDGICEAVDLTRQPDSECSTTDECVLAPAACCECGAGTSLSEIVAINRDRSPDFQASQCAGRGAVACDGCLWQPPTDFVAECVTGRCRVVPAPEVGGDGDMGGSGR